MTCPNSEDIRRNQKQPAQLAPKLDKDLIAYALVAGAAGIGLLASASDVEAKVIATTANIVVPINGGLIQFDINGDGIPDFGLSATAFAETFSGGSLRKHNAKPPLGGFFGGKLQAVPAQTANEVAVNGSYFGKPLAAAFAAGARIGPSLPFDEGTILMAGMEGTGCAGSSFAYGHWKGSHPPHVFLGVKFTDTSGAVHYGWVRIESTQQNVTNFDATITGYAYETTPNKPIKCGVTHGPVNESSLVEASRLDSKPQKLASLGMLVLGAPGLAIWRKQEEEAASGVTAQV
jgi:hypothetical protein